jgi:hypothetical protein
MKYDRPTRIGEDTWLIGIQDQTRSLYLEDAGRRSHPKDAGSIRVERLRDARGATNQE